MAIKKISRQEFDQILSLHDWLTLQGDDQVEWFADDAAGLLAAIARSQRCEDWFFVIIEPDGPEAFRSVNIKMGLASHDDARARLFQLMGTTAT